MHPQHVATRAVQPGEDDQLVAGPNAVETLRHLGPEHEPRVRGALVALLGGRGQVGEGRFDGPDRDQLIHGAQPRLAAVDLLSAGVVATSLKPDERRLAIHPAHVERISPVLRRRLFLERATASASASPTITSRRSSAGCARARSCWRSATCVILPKPLADDLETLRAGQVVWGWPHCVQDARMTQLAIERGLTLIAFEAMNHWTKEGNFSVHVFHKNNELAGYCSVLHALQLVGSTGDYGRRLNAAVISFGATARGAVRALSALGVSDVTVLTQRPTSGGRLAVRVGADAPASRRASRWRSCSPSTTSSSTASSRTPTTR